MSNSIYMKIIDTFTFCNELELLNYRLSILYDIVDYFVIVEGIRTQKGSPKKLYFDENKEMFSKFADKIIHVIDYDLKENICPWWNENHQRNYIHEGIKQIDLSPDDKIMVSDLDEIPDIEQLKKIKESNQKFDILHFEQDLYYYNLTCLYKTTKWKSAKIVSYDAYLNKFNQSPQDCRNVTGDAPISPGGWHLSYFGNIDFIRNKIEQCAHQEINLECFKTSEHIEKQIKNYDDLFMRSSEKFEKVEISENKYLPPQYDIYLSKFCV